MVYVRIYANMHTYPFERAHSGYPQAAGATSLYTDLDLKPPGTLEPGGHGGDSRLRDGHGEAVVITRLSSSSECTVFPALPLSPRGFFPGAMRASERCWQQLFTGLGK